MLKKYLIKIWHEAAAINNDILISCVKPQKTVKILDIGVFRGELALKRLKNIKNPDIYALDIDDEAIRSSKVLGIKAKKYDIEKGLPFKSNFFDIVCANQVIEHVVNVDSLAQEMFRVLKPKGFLIISTENLSSWHNIFALFLGWQAFSQQISSIKNIGNPFRLNDNQFEKRADIHIHIFTLKGLRELLELHRFKIERVFGAGYYPFFGKVSQILSKIDPCHSAFIGIKARKVKN